MEIRPATVNDLDMLLALNKEVQDIHVDKFPHVFKETSPKEMETWIRSQLEAKDLFVFAACEGKDVIGYIILRLITRAGNPFMRERKFAYIDQICVTKLKRKSGVGKKLLEHAINYAKHQGYDRIELDVWTENSTAKSAFEKFGFSTFSEKMVLNK